MPGESQCIVRQHPGRPGWHPQSLRGHAGACTKGGQGVKRQGGDVRHGVGGRDGGEYVRIDCGWVWDRSLSVVALEVTVFQNRASRVRVTQLIHISTIFIAAKINNNLLKLIDSSYLTNASTHFSAASSNTRSRQFSNCCQYLGQR